MAQPPLSPVPPRPYKMVFQAEANISDERQFVKDSNYLRELRTVVTGTTYRIAAKFENASDELFPGGKLNDISINAEGVSAFFSTEVGVPSIAPHDTAEIDLGEIQFAIPGMNWLRGQLVANDGRPVFVLRGKREFAGGLVESGFAAVTLEAALTVDYLSRILVSRPPSEERR